MQQLLSFKRAMKFLSRPLTHYCLSFFRIFDFFFRILRYNLRVAPIVYRLIGASLIGIFFR